MRFSKIGQAISNEGDSRFPGILEKIGPTLIIISTDFPTEIPTKTHQIQTESHSPENQPINFELDNLLPHSHPNFP